MCGRCRAPAASGREPHGEANQHVREDSVNTGLLGLMLGPLELVQDHPLNMLQALGCGELLIHHIGGALERHNFRGGNLPHHKKRWPGFTGPFCVRGAESYRDRSLVKRCT